MVNLIVSEGLSRAVGDLVNAMAADSDESPDN